MNVLLIVAFIVGSTFAAKLGKLEKEVLLIEEEEPVFPPQPYNFGFEVRDDDTTNYQNRAEVSDDQGRVKGSYSYVMPDGFVYTVTYEDKKDGNGLKAVVKKEPSGIEVIIPKPKPEDKAHNLVQKKL